MSTGVYWKICLRTRGAQPYSSIVILCNIGSQLALRTMGTATGTNRMGGGAAGPWRERPLRSPTCRVLRDLNLSKVETAVIRATCAWSGLGWMAGLGGQLGRVAGAVAVKTWREARSSHTRGAQVRAWTPHLMCFDNGDRIRKGWAMAGR